MQSRTATTARSASTHRRDGRVDRAIHAARAARIALERTATTVEG
jgi:hypothetical protein